MRVFTARFRTSLIGTPTPTACLMAALLCFSGQAGAAASPSGPGGQPADFTILSPRFGSSQTGQVDVTLQYITHNEDPAVQVKLNGRPLNDRRFTKSCQGATCTVVGKLTVWDGLRPGQNTLSATLTGRLHLSASSTGSSTTPVLLERTKFDYFQGLKSGGYNTVNYYNPVSIGLSTLPSGGGLAGSPWLQLTTGYPADFSSVADGWGVPGLPDSNNTVTIPYPDVSSGFICGGGTFQVWVLNRENPNNKETGACIYNVLDLAPAFQNKFSRPLGSQDLVILATAPGMTVPATGFDTSSLGGTDYSKIPSSEYPQAFVMIGVPGSTAGTAYESFSITSSSNHPNSSYLPSLNGTLMLDQNGNYNFVPSGDTTFEVHSDFTTGSYIKVGNNTYTPPANGNNFWLLVLDQETLTPVNYYPSAGASQNCDATTPTQSCGATYAVDRDGGNSLFGELATLSPHDLIFLVSQGCPIQDAAQMQIPLQEALQNIGGAPYAVNEMYINTSYPSQCAYSLVSVYDGNHTHPLNDPLALSVGGTFKSQNQLGSVHGFLGRNSQGLYDVAGTTQMVLDTTTNTQVSPVDYTFEQVASSQRQDWPLVDSAFPIEAYADISSQLLIALGETGSHLYDVRYFYTSSAFLNSAQIGPIILNKLGTTTTPASNPFTQQSWDNASPSEFTAALQQIGAELQQGTHASGYLGNNGVRSIMAGSDSTIYADMIGTASAISKDAADASNATANAKLSKELNLAGGIIALGSAIPEIGPIFGVVGGSLRVGSAAVALNSDSPSPEAVFDVSLSKLITEATTFTGNLTAGFDGAVDNIMSDSGKLAAVGALTSNSDSNWNLPNQVAQDALQSSLVDAASRSIWLDIIPQLYGVRQFFNGKSNSPGDYGVAFTPNHITVCENLYKNVDPASYGVYTSVGSSNLYDLYVFAESPTASDKDTAVSKALSDLLTTSGSYTIEGASQDGLNFPSMLLYPYSNMTHSPFQGPAGGQVKYCPAGS